MYSLAYSITLLSFDPSPSQNPTLNKFILEKTEEALLIVKEKAYIYQNMHRCDENPLEVNCLRWKHMLAVLLGLLMIGTISKNVNAAVYVNER